MPMACHHFFLVVAIVYLSKKMRTFAILLINVKNKYNTDK